MLEGRLVNQWGKMWKVWTIVAHFLQKNVEARVKNGKTTDRTFGKKMGIMRKRMTFAPSNIHQPLLVAGGHARSLAATGLFVGTAEPWRGGIGSLGNASNGIYSSRNGSRN